MKHSSLIVLVILSSVNIYAQRKGIYNRNFKETMTPIELDNGESVKYTRSDGSTLTLELVSTSANILFTNRDKIPDSEPTDNRGNKYRARLLYEFTCEVKVNGVPMTMRRYSGSQESFYEPYVINGVRIWVMGVKAIFDEYGGFLNTARRQGSAIPDKDARFVLHDMQYRICPGDLHPWFIDGDDRNDNFIYKHNFIDVGRSFNGDDSFMGAYMGIESHGGLDMDMAQNSLIYSPFDLDTQRGIRASGTKTWPDGSEWRINTGHMIEKYIPDNTPVDGGEVLALGARRSCWWHPHSHFGFQIFETGILYNLDAWSIFWQLFEDNKKRDGTLRAMMEPLNHSKTGTSIKFRNKTNQNGQSLSYYWTFGDGGWSNEENPSHVFAKAGIYPVTLTVDDGENLSAFTQHITIEGQALSRPVLSLSAIDEPSFRKRPIDAMDIYGWPVKFIPHTFEFNARPSRPKPNKRKITINNLGGGRLDSASIGINYLNNRTYDWVNIEYFENGEEKWLEVGVDCTNIPPGEYSAIVSVHVPSAINSFQRFRVVMSVPSTPATSLAVLVDDKDEKFYCTPYFWVGHRFHGWGWPELKNAEGYNHFYLMNGGRDTKGEYARFRPDLGKGEYDIWLYEHTPYASGPPADHDPAKFQVRVVHAEGDTTVWMEPEKTTGYFPRPFQHSKGYWSWMEPQHSRKIGTFKFEEGNDGYVEILADGATGQVLVDAVRFLKRGF